MNPPTPSPSLHPSLPPLGSAATAKIISFLGVDAHCPGCRLLWVMLSSGAELSHCEQRGNQSLFTNQLSSEPGWRGEGGAGGLSQTPHAQKHSSRSSGSLINLSSSPINSHNQTTLVNNHVFFPRSGFSEGRLHVPGGGAADAVGRVGAVW